MKIIPFGKNVLVKPTEAKRALGESSLCEYGEVIAIGHEVEYLKVGQTIGYTVFGVNSLEIENEKHYFIPETSEFVLGILELAEESVQGSLAS